MNPKRSLLIGLILGALIGWILVSFYLYFPFIVKNLSFLLGFIACLELVSLGLILLFVWNKGALLSRLTGYNATTEDAKKPITTHSLIWILVSVFVVMGGLVSSFLIIKQNELSRSQTQYQNKQIKHQSELIESKNRSSMVFLMSNILDKVDDELKNDPKRTLSDETISRIAALSYSFKPYSYADGDSSLGKRYSPERGQLLLALSKMNMDPSSFNKIKFQAQFSWADLRGAELYGADLSGVDLRKANLNGADLRKANLNEADLKGANLWGAYLRKAKLSGADLKRANLGWADLNEADLSGADLSSANLTSAKLRKADLSGADLTAADLSGAFLNEANLRKANLIWAVLIRANLKGANLRMTKLSEANFSEANLSGAQLTKAGINNENWLEKLDVWRVTGAKEIQEGYKMVDDKTGESSYRLKRIRALKAKK